MKTFDKKDLITWSNRHDVKVGTKGYFANCINDLKDDIEHDNFRTLVDISDDYNCCFDCYSSIDSETYSFSFFLPLDKVKKEKKYRPFKDAYEFYKFFQPDTSITRKDFRNKHLLNYCITNKKKDADDFITTEMIIKVEVGVNNGCHLTIINGRALEYWFANYEIMNANGEWQPFGVLED